MVAHHPTNLPSGASAADIMAAKVDAHRKHLEATFNSKSDTFQSAHARFQSAQDQTQKYEQKVDKQKRAQGENPFNPDGSLSFLTGYSNESHLREPLEIVKELMRYVENDMLRLRQNRIETLLTEFITSMNHDILVGKYPEGSREIFQLRQNVWAAQNINLALNRRNGIVYTKADLVRKMVSLLYFRIFLSKFYYFRPT